MKITVYAIAPRTSWSQSKSSRFASFCFASFRLSVICVLLAFTFGSSCFSQESVSADHITKSIRQLGSKSFIGREDATQQLISFGAYAEPYLVQASGSSDREIRRRSLRVLKLIRSQQRDVLLAKFQAEPTWNPGKQLPGWTVFAKRYGAAAAARTIYTKIASSEWDLIEACFNAENEFQRRNELFNRYHELSKQGLSYQNCQPGTAMALFFLCSPNYSEPDQNQDLDGPHGRGPALTIGNGLHQNLFNYLRNPGVQPVLTRRTNDSRQQQDIVRALVEDWIIAASEPSLNDRNSRSALHHARIYQFEKAGQIVTERILNDPKSLATTKSNAMQSVVLRNDKSQIGLLEPFLEDGTPLGRSGKRVKQLRDIALACLMKLNGHDLSLIGVKPHKSGMLYPFEFQTLGFVTDGDRKKAIETYSKLQAAKEEQQP